MVRMELRPPDLDGQADRAIPERLHRGRKLAGLADVDDLRLVALLRGAVPEGRELRRREHALDDVDLLRLEGGDLRVVVARRHVEAARIDDAVASLLEYRGKA